jgi:predicted phage baseplate assembly protein
MALEAIQLDTLTWDQMVSAIQTRIITDSSAKWTLQAPVDPGVTLLELFAWLLDQRIYWMNQVPDSLILAVLKLLGQSPQPATAAMTLLQMSSTATPAGFQVATPETLMELAESNPPIVFTLNNNLIVLPLVANQPTGVSVNGVDHTNDLVRGSLVPLLASGQTSSQVAISLPLAAPLPTAATGQMFSLMIELQTPEDLHPQWTSEAVAGVPAPAKLTWSYTSSSTGASTNFSQVDDQTVGLRRSGVVRMAIPSDWQGQPSATGTAYTILLQIQHASFTCPPFLASIAANVVIAQHLWARTKNPDATQWLPLPGNVISLPQVTLTPAANPLLPEAPPIESSVALQITNQSGTVSWKRVNDFSLSGPTDTVFVVDRTKSEILFGDGLTGRLPYAASDTRPTIQVGYQAGGGTAGEIGEGLSWEAVSPISPATGGVALPLIAVNLSAGDGGAESETLPDAQLRTAALLQGRNRAITKSDYENLAISTPGVALRRAFAAVGHHPNFPGIAVPGAVTVFVVPYAPRVLIDGPWAKNFYVSAPQPDPGALQLALARLTAGKLIATDIFVCPPVYRPVWLGLTVAVDSPLSVTVRQAVISALQTFLDPLVGGDDQQGWLFGDPLRPSALMRVAQTALGEAGDVQSVSVRIDGMTEPSNCNDVPINSNELVNLKHVDIRTQQRFAPAGGLR